MQKYICYKVIQESKDGMRLVNVPSENVEEVVRCRDCKYYQTATAFGYPIKDCKYYHFEDMEADDYCSRGERKDED